ncbi:MAG: LCP family protein [Eggerthellaceae bacterium]|nr:LCP family protein [Eggerthellaceae bacterium]
MPDSRRNSDATPRHTRRRAEDYTTGAHAASAGRATRGSHASRGSHAGAASAAGRTTVSSDSARSVRAGGSAGTARTDASARSARIDSSVGAARADASARSARVDVSARAARSEGSARTTRTEGSVRSARTGGSSRSVRSGRAGQQMNASHVEFSNTRKSRQASRGYVDYVQPMTLSGESDAAYRRRSGRVGYTQGVQRKSKVKSAAVVLLLLLLAALVAVGVGVFAYFKTSDSKLSLADSNAAQALVAEPDQGAYYALFAAELGTATSVGGAETDAYILARIDEEARLITMIGIPSSLSVHLSDGEYHPLYMARGLGGDAELITKIAEFAGVGISHYVRTDTAGIAKLIDLFGNVTITLPEEVDDPDAGTVHLEAGERQLNARSALTVLRADNLVGGATARENTRVAFCLELLRVALISEGIDFAGVVADVAESIQTDWSASQLLDLGKSLRPYETLSFYSALMPGYEASGGYVAYGGEWENMMANVEAGIDPLYKAEEVIDVDRSKVVVEIRNGGGVTGMGAKMGELLAAKGYVIDAIGNTDDGAMYPETLVVYSDPKNADAALAIVEDAGVGRAFLSDTGYYKFETDVLVIVGQDWLPVD